MNNEYLWYVVKHAQWGPGKGSAHTSYFVQEMNILITHIVWSFDFGHQKLDHQVIQNLKTYEMNFNSSIHAVCQPKQFHTFNIGRIHFIHSTRSH